MNRPLKRDYVPQVDLRRSKVAVFEGVDEVRPRQGRADCPVLLSHYPAEGERPRQRFAEQPPETDFSEAESAKGSFRKSDLARLERKARSVKSAFSSPEPTSSGEHER